ncbi:hypothetical protein G7069_04055 [Lysobacter sp. HDW10]|uniref:BPSS1780 family membrane protein n=1 Tax=Lysobacter sp. HDW10 TaxID=2714936 RepID=UPI00140A744A|nr:BPSS1780 family membrane protein [Lysobacter sp. HDW10]QIK80843.1 hypothetical protein G7069_04055 [Lysobacter sp. HDW10]
MNKVPASSGAQWILDAFAMFRAAPGPFLLVAGVYAVGILVATVLLKSAPVFGMLVLLVLTLMQPIFVGALLLGAHDLADGKKPGNDLLQRVYASGKAPRLLLVLLPQIAAGIISGVLLYVMVGTQNLAHTMQVLEAIQNNPEAQAALMKDLPIAAFGRWALISVVIGLIAAMFSFLAIPQILFGERRGFDAMGDSFRAVASNIGAMVLAVVLFVITLIGLTIVFMIVTGLISVIAGRGAADLVSSFLQILVLLPLQALMTFAAWRSVFGGQAPAARIDDAHHDQFHA